MGLSSCSSDVLARRRERVLHDGGKGVLRQGCPVGICRGLISSGQGRARLTPSLFGVYMGCASRGYSWGGFMGPPRVEATNPSSLSFNRFLCSQYRTPINTNPPWFVHGGGNFFVSFDVPRKEVVSLHLHQVPGYRVIPVVGSNNCS